jgi:hypothetical protein
MAPLNAKTLFFAKKSKVRKATADGVFANIHNLQTYIEPNVPWRAGIALSIGYLL